MTLFLECVIAIVLFTIIVIPVALINPLFVVGDYPPAVIKRCVELKIIPERETRLTKKELLKKIIAMVLFVFLFAFVVHKVNGAETFLDGFINSYIIWLAVCWWDAFVLDCILFCHLKRFRIPGTEDMKEYKDYLFHIKGSVRGSLIGIIACVFIGFVIMIL